MKVFGMHNPVFWIIENVAVSSTIIASLGWPLLEFRIHYKAFQQRCEAA